MSAPKPIEVRPAMGGRLMSDLSSDNIGLFNYAVKRDWRRTKDGEMRSEGYDRFNPNPLNVNVPMPPTADEITLVAEALAANGKRALVVGSKTTLWRYFGVENGACFEAGVFEDGVYDDNPGAWLEIGSGFSAQGQRWEAEAIAGWLILNNGVDLPVSYRVQDYAVEPLWELREQGIASVGTIGKFNNLLECGDIRQLNAEKHVAIMSAIAGAVTAGQTGCSTFSGLGTVNSGAPAVEGNTLTIASGVLTGLEGRTIRMANGVERTIAAVLTPLTATLSGDAFLAEPAQPVYLLGANDTLLSVHWNVLWPSLTAAKLVGLRIFWDSGDTRKITAADADGKLWVDSDQPIAVGALSLENPAAYAVFTDEAYLDRLHARVVPSMPAEPRRFAAVVPGVVTAGSNLMQLTYPVRSLESGREVTITDAGENGEPLRTTILWAYPGIAKVLVLSDGALPGIVTAKAAAASGESAAQLGVAQATAALSDQNAALTAAQAAQDAGDTVAKLAVETAKTELAAASLYLSAHAGDAAAQLAVDQATTALAVANAALAAIPNAADRAAAVAAASGKVVALTEALTAAQAALTKATAARVEADALETTADALLTRTDAVSSIVSYDDLDGDGSGILRIIELRGYLLVCKETGFFIGRYIGKPGQAFVFEEIKVAKETALRYKGALVNVAGQYILYAGQSDFFTFDLVTRTPQLAGPFQACSKLFFDGIVSQDTTVEPNRTLEVGAVVYVVYEGLDLSKLYEWSYNGSVEVLSPTDYGSGPLSFGIAILKVVGVSQDYSLKEVVTSPEERIFAAANSITGEVWFVVNSETDNVLRFDTQFGTVSTSTMTITAAASVRRPENKVVVGRSVDWFVMGSAGGLVLRYGCTNEPERQSGTIRASSTVAGRITATAAFFTPQDVGKSLMFANHKCVAITGYIDNRNVTVLGATTGILAQTFRVLPGIWHRAGVGYDSVLESGMEAFGMPNSEKRWTQYVPVLSSKQSANTALRVTLRGALNPSEAVDHFEPTISKPLTENLVTLILGQHYLGDRVTVSGINNPCELVARNFLIAGVDSRSFNRKAP